VRGSFFVRLASLRRTSVSLPAAIACTFVLCTSLLFGLVYWQISVYMTAHFDRIVVARAVAIAQLPPRRRIGAIEQRATENPGRTLSAGLFDEAGKRLAGNVAALPSEIVSGMGMKEVVITRIDPDGRHQQVVRAIVLRLSDGKRMILGRDTEENKEIATIVARALMLGLLPAIGLAILAATLLSLGARQRIEEVTALASRITVGDLRERLPVPEGDHPYDKLSRIVNGMLDHIESLVEQLANVGNDIAHDLRTPLTRVRATLERARENAQTVQDLRAAVDRAMDGLDQSLTIVTALLRIAEIEHGRRIVGFANVDLSEIAREAAELYSPIAEDRRIVMRSDLAAPVSVVGDRDLLFEAAANLVGNAVKFTPDGGSVDIAVHQVAGDTVLRVSDSGPGISEAEREAVTRRFYRADKSRRTTGTGLGLSLVAAIVKLHGFRLNISGGPGCIVEIVCPNTNPIAN
jgi:signal transduction histidine kinase